MKAVFNAAFLFIWSAAVVFGGQVIAFERNDAAWIANLDGTGEKRIADGIFPAISPDGRRIALTVIEKFDTTYIRHIGVAELATGKTTVFKDVSSDNVYYPQWSPDGKRILFTLRQNEVWNLATIAPDGTDFRILRNAKPNEPTLYSPCWAREGGSVFCQDMANIYQITLDGSVLARWNIEKVIPNGGMSGDSRIAVSPDGKRLLLSIDMGEEHHRKDWDGPPPALWIFDLTTRHAVRITPRSVFGWDGVWIDNDNILFSSQPVGEKFASIYRISVNGENLKRLINDARFPSVSAP